MPAAATRLAVGLSVCLALMLVARATAIGQQPAAPLRIAVLDPLSHKIACACVQAHAQRRYDMVAERLSTILGRPVAVAYGETLNKPLQELGGIDLAIGKQAPLDADLTAHHITHSGIARLTDPTGSTNLTGLFIVRAKSPYKRLADLRGKTIVFGPEETQEKHAAALAALSAAGAHKGIRTKVAQSCTIAAAMLLAGEADAAVISSYAESLLYGCGTARRGSLRVIGRTAPVPFVAVYATDTVADVGSLTSALRSLSRDRALLRAMESRDGFVAYDCADWSDFRGAGRHAHAILPASLPAKPVLVWKRAMTGPSPAGICATTTHVVVADKDPTGKLDVFRCLSADSGEQLWRVAYPAAGRMDNTNAPRATAVIHPAGLVYTLGAFGHLTCTRLDTGHVLWRRNLAKDYGAKVPTWGYCSTPLLTAHGLIVNPGAPAASVVCLHPATGKEVWRSRGGGAAYASLEPIATQASNAPDLVVGCDAQGFACWDSRTGAVVSSVPPARPNEFLVPTPVVIPDAVAGAREPIGAERVLLAGENNGARLHRLDPRGVIDQQPIAANPDFAPDTVTPVVCGGLIFGGRYALMCLDEHLRTCWKQDEPAYDGHYSLIADDARVLILSQKGVLSLIAADRTAHRLISRWRLPKDAAYWSHPAIVRDRLYVRSSTTIYCYRLR